MNLKKISFFFILTIVSVSAYLFLSGEPQVLNHPSKGTGVVAFGDSLVYGQGSTSGNDFVSLLSKELGLPIKNFGVSGDTTSLALIRIDEVLKEKPKVVMVLLGGNDYLRKIPKEETFKNLSEIVKKFQNTGAVVVVLGVRGGILRDSYEEDFKNFAKEHKTAYVSNVLDGLFGNGQFMFDSIHPNDKGYAVIASRVLPVLRQYVE